MCRNPLGNYNKQRKMVAKSNRDIRYKPIAGRLHEHLGFKLSVDRLMETSDNVYCIHCDKSFAYHGFKTSSSKQTPAHSVLSPI